MENPKLSSKRRGWKRRGSKKELSAPVTQADITVAKTGEVDGGSEENLPPKKRLRGKQPHVQEEETSEHSNQSVEALTPDETKENVVLSQSGKVIPTFGKKPPAVRNGSPPLQKDPKTHMESQRDKINDEKSSRIEKIEGPPAESQADDDAKVIQNNSVPFNSDQIVESEKLGNAPNMVTNLADTVNQVHSNGKEILNTIPGITGALLFPSFHGRDPNDLQPESSTATITNQSSDAQAKDFQISKENTPPCAEVKKQEHASQELFSSESSETQESSLPAETVPTFPITTASSLPFIAQDKAKQLPLTQPFHSSGDSEHQTPNESVEPRQSFSTQPFPKTAEEKQGLSAHATPDQNELKEPLSTQAFEVKNEMLHEALPFPAEQGPCDQILPKNMTLATNVDQGSELNIAREASTAHASEKLQSISEKPLSSSNNPLNAPEKLQNPVCDIQQVDLATTAADMVVEPKQSKKYDSCEKVLRREKEIPKGIDVSHGENSIEEKNGRVALHASTTSVLHVVKPISGQMFASEKYPAAHSEISAAQKATHDQTSKPYVILPVNTDTPPTRKSTGAQVVNFTEASKPAPKEQPPSCEAAALPDAKFTNPLTNQNLSTTLGDASIPVADATLPSGSHDKSSAVVRTCDSTMPEAPMTMQLESDIPCCDPAAFVTVDSLANCDKRQTEKPSVDSSTNDNSIVMGKESSQKTTTPEKGVEAQQDCQCGRFAQSSQRILEECLGDLSELTESQWVQFDEDICPETSRTRQPNPVKSTNREHPPHALATRYLSPAVTPPGQTRRGIPLEEAERRGKTVIQKIISDLSSLNQMLMSYRREIAAAKRRYLQSQAPLPHSMSQPRPRSTFAPRH